MEVYIYVKQSEKVHKKRNTGRDCKGQPQVNVFGRGIKLEVSSSGFSRDEFGEYSYDQNDRRATVYLTLSEVQSILITAAEAGLMPGFKDLIAGHDKIREAIISLGLAQTAASVE